MMPSTIQRQTSPVVLVKNMKNTHRMGGKLDIRWTGPYEVIDDIGKMRYKVRYKKTGKTLKQILHCSRLKHYNHDVSWVIKYIIVPAIYVVIIVFSFTSSANE